VVGGEEAARVPAAKHAPETTMSPQGMLIPISSFPPAPIYRPRLIETSPKNFEIAADPRAPEGFLQQGVDRERHQVATVEDDRVAKRERALEESLVLEETEILLGAGANGRESGRKSAPRDG